MALDPVVNFFRSQIATLPVASGGTVIVLPTGDGNKLPNPATDGAFNLTIYNADDPFVTPEIVRVTGRSGDTLTVTRAQEGTTATNKTAGSTWSVELTPTAKTIQDIDSKKVEKTGDTMTGTLTATKLIPSGNVTAGNGMYLPAANTVAVSTNGSEKIRATATEVIVNETGADFDFRVEGDTDSNLLFVDAGADRVGVGTTTPLTKLGVLQTNAGINVGVFNLLSITQSNNSAFIPINTGPKMLLNVAYNSGANVINTAAIYSIKKSTSAPETFGGWLVFQTGDSTGTLQDRVSIDYTGNVGIGTTTPATKLDVVGSIRSSVGILFGTDTSAANTLDDYEEGTWTPTFIPQTGAFGTLTFSLQSGKYTKIGNHVTFEITVATSNVSVGTASGFVTIGNLPFTYTGVSNSFAATSLGICIRFATNIFPATLIVSNGDNKIQITKSVNSTDSSVTLLQVSDLTTGATTFRNYISISGTYITT
jgi:hypothetical protein